VHPAASIILFTTASGLGYGLLAVAGLYTAFGLMPSGIWFGVVTLGLALGLVTLGLMSSTFHLGHPERAWRAFSQWRSSWLSREGILAVATYVPAGLLALGFLSASVTGGLWRLSGLLAALGALITVYCTSMIYASLKAVPRWHNPWVPAVYLLLAAMTGLIWFDALLRLFGMGQISITAVASLSIAVAWIAKSAYWASIDGAALVASAASATGLTTDGDVRLLESPHTTANYLMREMGFTVARKHARKLRRLTVVCAFLLPFTMQVVASAAPAIVGTIAVCLSAGLAMLGVVMERWLFFAEAQHTVTLYYGRTHV
jgi:DMSO reductase anchor subunit